LLSGVETTYKPALSATCAQLGRSDDAPWCRYTFSDSDFAVEAPHPTLSNFDPRHGV
jgi:4-hydroxy-3-polyprenylbenzoate decarboxylase